jgi:hypothetical protein
VHTDGKDAPKTEFRILDLSSESRYHLDSTLIYREAIVLNDAISFLNANNLALKDGFDEPKTLEPPRKPDLNEDLSDAKAVKDVNSQELSPCINPSSSPDDHTSSCRVPKKYLWR